MSLTEDELESHLFKCADIIRDAVDPTDYKEYILPLVYYKAISDEFEIELEENEDEYGEEHARRKRLFDVLFVLQFELVRDGLVVDERENVLLVVGRVDRIADDIRTLEKM